jgi:gas vesicle protein
MGQDPDAIRQEIEQTRNEMGDTVEAIGYKADVPSRAKDSVKERTGRMRDKISGATPGGGEMKQGARQAVGMAQENPIGLALGAVAVGFVTGMLIPSTEAEDQKLGPMADQVKQQAADTGQEALERGKEVAQEAAKSAAETAKESGREHGEQLADSARESAREVRS